tara:strand:+ start:527 stop:1330 length:804 start_codon:yes stop_codon:yes gene_type:complete
VEQIKTPRVYLVAKTSLVVDGLNAFLSDIGSPDWSISSDVSDGENLVEVAGRICYRSWQPYDPDKPNSTNPNITKVREGNDKYLRNILESGHGSVLEHVCLTFICSGVSRVFTHELVRHRAGMAYSQESLRYVRLDDLSFWFPEVLKGNVEAQKKFKDVVSFLEGVQKDLAALFNIKDIKDFATKKKLTSMFRRLAPEGIGTTIMVTGNLRSWRHIIAMRTSQAAEEEIKIIGDKIARICKKEYPNIFQDMEYESNTGEWKFIFKKV